MQRDRHGSANYTQTIKNELRSALDMRLDIDLSETLAAHREDAFELICSVR